MQQDSIKITDQILQRKEQSSSYIKACLKTLLPIDRRIVNLLCDIGAANASTIRNSLLDIEIYTFLHTYGEYLPAYIVNEEAPPKYNIKETTLFKYTTKMSETELKKLAKQIQLTDNNKMYSYTRRTGLIKVLFSANHIKLPSADLIKNRLTNLIEEGWISSKEEKAGRSNALYFIRPELLQALIS